MSEIYIDSDGSTLRSTIAESGTIQYHNSLGQLHRLDGPAIQWCFGSLEWRKDNLLHRLDGPAVEWPDGGAKLWCVEGRVVDPQALVAYWLERGRCCWYDESTQELRFGDV